MIDFNCVHGCLVVSFGWEILLYSKPAQWIAFTLNYDIILKKWMK